MNLNIVNLCSAILLTIASVGSRAESFEAADLADESPQTRTLHDGDAELVLRATLSVIQDLKFFVTEAELEPGLIVATVPGCRFDCGATLTISLNASRLRPEDVRVRVSLEKLDDNVFGQARERDYNHFYQNFFTHLDRTLFRLRSTP